MAKQYDATFKQLVEGHPADWVSLAGLPAGEAVTVVDADLSTVTAAADKVLRVEGAQPYIAHLEFQAGADPDFDGRVLLYNVLLRWRFRLPVRSVAVLLHPRAVSAGLTGGVRDGSDPDCRLEFSYRQLRVWEQPPELFLGAGLGTLPLAVATAASAASEASLAGVLARIAGRLRDEAPERRSRELWAATYVLSGLSHDLAVAERLMKGVWQMEESVTYQAILQQGIQQGVTRGVEQGVIQGRTQEAKNAVLLVGRKRFGPPGAAAVDALQRIDDPERLEALLERALTASSWDELLAGET